MTQNSRKRKREQMLTWNMESILILFVVMSILYEIDAVYNNLCINMLYNFHKVLRLEIEIILFVFGNTYDLSYSNDLFITTAI